jgi:glycerophosphoryl diester phosphodiesterase
MAEHAASTSAVPLRIAHRGVRSVARENTIPAFLAAVENSALACDGVELDIHSTASGQLVVHHDPLLPGGRRIAELDRAQVAATRLADGSRLPLLEEALEAIGPLTAWIEAKTLEPAADDVLLGILREQGRLARDQVHSFDHRIIARLAGRADRPGLGVLSASYPIDPVGPVQSVGAGVLWQEWSLVDRALMGRSAEAGVGVIAWTPPAGEVGRLVALGVLGVCVDL